MQEFKAKAKTTQKMTRDGVVETNKATGAQTRKSQRETDDFSGGTAENVTGKAFDRAATERQRHKAKKRRRKAKKEAKQAQEATGKQTSRLQFSEAERTDPELAKYVKKSEKAADRLEAAREKIPKQKRIKAAREFDEATGRAAKDLRNAGKSAGKAARKTGKAAGEATKKTTDFIARHWKGILTVGVFLLLIVMIFTGLSSCAAVIQGGVTSIVGTSYTAEDEAIREVEADYKELEKDLREEIADIETDYPDYDEYQYHLDEIGHDPFALASYLTAKLYDYTRQEAQAELQALFEKQYTLTLREEIQTRYRTETTTDPETGETTTEEVPYDYYILHVTLTNKNIETLAGELLTPEQKEMFDIYMETKGNKPDVFGEDYATTPGGGGQYTDYEIPPEALSDERFAAMIAEAEKYLGYPYVWGGSSPSTSFDCSGFVCWVINHSGAGSVGRTTAQGIFNYTTPIAPSEAKPGDIIFFTGTYDSGSAVSHVGIYAGNGMMIHCGNPISYASVNTPYWQQHFYAYGRLP